MRRSPHEVGAYEISEHPAAFVSLTRLNLCVDADGIARSHKRIGGVPVIFTPLPFARRITQRDRP
jgi:hypothetical protein